MTEPTRRYSNLDVSELLVDDEQLLAVATIALNAEGAYALHIVDVDGAPTVMTAAEKASALRQLATAIEAEAIYRTPNDEAGENES